MPTERLIENVVYVPSLLFPEPGNPAGFERDGASLPNILYAHARDLLRIKVEHVRKRWPFFPLPAHVAKTVKSPTGPTTSAVCERLWFVEIHEQRSTSEGIKVNVDERLLKRKCRHVVAPAFAPVAD